MCDQSLRSSEVAPITAPTTFQGCRPPKKFYPNFHTCVVAHDVDKFGEVIPTGPEVIHPNTQNCVQVFELSLSPVFSGHPNFWTWHKATPISRHLAKFHSDRPRGPEISPLNQLPQKLFWREAPNLGPTLSKYPHFQSCVKSSRCRGS